MNDLDVRTVVLEPMLVAKSYGFGSLPELEAFDILFSWARNEGLTENIQNHRFFGFNNPDPAPGSPNYGYEQWMTIDQKLQAHDKVQFKDFPGGRFAVTRCKGVGNLETTWQSFVAWIEDSIHQLGSEEFTYCMEELLNPQELLKPMAERDYENLVFDLYLPVLNNT